MSYMDQEVFASGGIQALSFDEIDYVAGASEWGDNVLKFGGVGGTIGGLVGLVGGPPGAATGAAIGIVAGAVVGTVVTLVDD